VDSDYLSGNSGNFGERLSEGKYPASRIRCSPDPTSSVLRDEDPIDGQPGDKSPGYDRASLRDEAQTVTIKLLVFTYV
jgi:hypothetical protein